MKSPRILLHTTALLLLPGGIAFGQSVFSTASGSWHTSGLWSPAVVPTTEQVFIGSVAPGGVTATISTANATSGQAHIAFNPGQTGSVIVTAGGGLVTPRTWGINGGLIVGTQGNGTLTVEAGGTVTNTIGSIGLNSDSTGEATVTGTNSLWQNLGSLFVGYGGNGTLTVADGGRVTASIVRFTLFSGSSQGTLNLNGTAGSRGVLETGYLLEGNGNLGGKINFDGGILRATGNQANFLQNFESGDIEFKAGGAFIDSNGFDVAISSGSGGLTTSNTMTGVGGLTKLGKGSLTLEGDHLYTGITKVEGGMLIVNGTLVSDVIVEAGGAMGGSGSIAGLTTVLGNHSPGNSPGTSAHGDLTYLTGASVLWEMNGNTASGRGSMFDGIDVTDALSFSGTTLVDLAFNGVGSTVNWMNTFWAANRQWLMYDVGGSTTGFGNLFVGADNWADGSGILFNSQLAGSYFDVFQSGQDVFLRYNFAAIPEPSRALLLMVGLLGATLRRRR